MDSPTRHQLVATGLGLLTIVFWSSSFALARSLSEQLGPLTAGAAVHLVGGALGLAGMTWFAGGFGRLRRCSARRQAGRGAAFVLYEVCLFLAVGLARTRQQVIEVGIINYLWPGLTMALAVPILRYRARATLPAGMIVAFAGVVLVASADGGLAWQNLPANIRANAWPYLLALVAAVSWALYTNLSRLWAEENDHFAVPVFLVAAGLLLAGLRTFFGERSELTARSMVELAYMATFPGVVAFVLWDLAVRKGSVILLASLSYLAPVLSTAATCLYLRIAAGPRLWLACALTIAGAAICRLSVVTGEARGGPARPAEGV